MMVPDHRAGTTLRCPRCGVELRVPGTAAKPSAPLVPPPSGVIPPVATAEKETSNLVESPPPIAPPNPPVSSASTDALSPRSPNQSPAVKSSARTMPGWSPPSVQSSMALYLSLVLAALAIFGVAPAVWEWFELWRNPEQPPVPPWVFALLITGVLQLAYAVYLSQVPDWSALWATTIATLAVAAAWAALLGTTLLGRDESALVTLFRYADKLEGNRAAMWCFIMLCFTSVLAYFLGHTAVRWQRSYRLLREVRG
jgi:hypothetical protein